MRFLSIIITLMLFCISNLKSQHQNILISDEYGPNEPSIIINPKNPSQIVAGSNTSNLYFSTDTGRTWTYKDINSKYGLSGDPSFAIDTNGYFYYFHLSKKHHWLDRIVCQRSIDGGSTWDLDTYMGYTETKQQDKQWAVVDPRNNKIYVTWTQFDKYGSQNSADSSHIMFSKSFDSGKTWSKAKRLDKLGGNCIDSDETVEGAVPAVGPNGEVYVSWVGKFGIMFDKSMDHGKTWLDNDIFVTSVPGGWDFNIPGISRCNGLPITVCDLSNGPNKGTIYINWTDQRNGENDTDVWLVKSIDSGNTWSQPIRVNDDLPGRQQFFTWMAIDQSTGYLYFIFYDRRNYNDENTDVFIAVSKDGGKSFQNSKISENPFIPSKYVFFGDYNNITVTNGIVRPIWTRMHNKKNSIWTAIINTDSLTTSINTPNFNQDFFELNQNEPNPFKDETAISFKLRNHSKVSLIIYDSIGNKISDYIKNQEYSSGKHIIFINNKKLKLKPGLYLYSLKAGNRTKSFKMVISE